MKVVILAGGLGTRLQELTKTIPKPMVKVGGKPLIEHIMLHYSNYGYKDFYIALGYKGKLIKKYFKKKKFRKWNINLIETGKNTMTGGRLKKLSKYLDNDTFLMTYGDGISNINLNKLVKFHKKHNKMITLSAVRPPARFGAIKISGSKVKYFKEKSKLDEGWINGGFFVIEKNFLRLINNDKTFLEREPLEKACKNNQLLAFKHNGFWQCMDTMRDKIQLDTALKKKLHKIKN